MGVEIGIGIGIGIDSKSGASNYKAHTVFPCRGTRCIWRRVLRTSIGFVSTAASVPDAAPAIKWNHNLGESAAECEHCDSNHEHWLVDTKCKHHNNVSLAAVTVEVKLHKPAKYDDRRYLKYS
jgi:hypothetical protein